MHAFDVIVVGGGVIGCAVAEAIRASVGTVALVESGSHLGAGASAAAIGGITHQSDEFCLGPLGDIAAYSRAIFPHWLERIGNEADIDIPVLETGQIQVAIDEEELRRLEYEVVPKWHAKGFEVLPVPLADLWRDEPLLSREIIGAYLLPAEIAIEPTVLMEAFRRLLYADSRVTTFISTTVTAVALRGEQVVVSTGSGEVLTAGRLIIATGHLTSRLVSLPDGVTFPVKGQAAEFDPPGYTTYPLKHHVYAKHRGERGASSSYLVPRADGRIAVGVTYEEGLSDVEATPEGRDTILYGFHRLVPAARAWTMKRHWSGVRPGSVDGIPLIGPIDASERVILATGHYGLGITLAPITAELVASIVRGGDDGDAFRFAQTCRPDRHGEVALNAA